MNKRDAVLSLLDGTQTPGYTPAAFFIHFDRLSRRFGPAAVRKHLQFFRYTDMDLLKIQYEKEFPRKRNIRQPADWVKMPCYSSSFYSRHLNIAKRLVGEAKAEALVIMTVYSPFMCAGQVVGDATVTEHVKENPEQTMKGLEIITESLLKFVKACSEIGVDGFYACTQGGEEHRFEDQALFEEHIKPYDVALFSEMERACQFNILHICDNHGDYSDLSPFVDYPGHVVNCGLRLGQRKMSTGEVSQLFGRPYMGGLDKRGVITTGSPSEIEQRVSDCIRVAPQGFILGADCTLPSDINWDRIRTAISTAHNQND